MTTDVLEFTAPRTAEFVRHDLGVLSDGAFLVENEWSLVSPGTETALYSGSHVGFADPEITWAKYPIAAGYASAGIVTESRNGSVSAGTRVVHYGNHAGRTVVNAGDVWASVPEGLAPEEACFGRFAEIAYSSVRAAVRPVRAVRVYGAGIVGNLAAQWFGLEFGIVPTIAELSGARRDVARACGVAIDTGDGAPDTIVEATGVPAVVSEALQRLAPGGQVILLGSTRGNVDLNVYKLVHRRYALLSGAHETILGSDVPAVLADAVARIASGELVVAPMVTHRISPADLPGIYDRLLTDPEAYLGVLVEWGKKS